MKAEKIFFVCMMIFSQIICISRMQAENFSFKYQTGDVYRILSTVRENVIVNGQFSHQAEILNRISVTITDTDEDGNGTHDAVFMTSEMALGRTGQTFSWGNEYKSIFLRSRLGKYTMDDSYFMPVVRDVPLFPDKELNVGDTWVAEGYEAHDLRMSFNLQTPYKVPFAATYTYQGTVPSQDGRILHQINCRYNMFFETPQKTPPDPNRSSGDISMSWEDYPVSTMGYSNQTIFWDNEIGQIDHYSEDFRIIIETAYGNTFEFKGTAQAEVDLIPQDTDSDENLTRVQDQIRDMGLQNTEVSVAEEGLTISIENIQFKADSAELEDSEKVKLRQIAEILSQFPDNDLLISGHTALAGTAEARQKLSEERAAAVAEYLVELGVKDKYHVFARGFGADKPVADNHTEAGKARNRRVEITIMDK